MFRHDPQTNRLSLKEGKREPWLRDLAFAKGERMRTWLYCLECQSRYFETGKRASGHIPFRDRASQSSMRRPADKELVETPDAPEEIAAETQPEDVDSSPELPLLGDDDGEDEDSREEVDDPLAAEEKPDPVDTKWPSLEEYQAKWASHLEQHSRPNSGGFSRNNLVPEPIPQLWQDCPTADCRKVATRGITGRRACARSERGGSLSFQQARAFRYAQERRRYESPLPVPPRLRIQAVALRRRHHPLRPQYWGLLMADIPQPWEEPGYSRSSVDFPVTKVLLSAGGQLQASRPHAVGIHVGLYLEQALRQVPRFDPGGAGGSS